MKKYLIKKPLKCGRFPLLPAGSSVPANALERPDELMSKGVITEIGEAQKSPLKVSAKKSEKADGKAADRSSEEY